MEKFNCYFRKAVKPYEYGQQYCLVNSSKADEDCLKMYDPFQHCIQRAEQKPLQILECLRDAKIFDNTGNFLLSEQ